LSSRRLSFARRAAAASALVVLAAGCAAPAAAPQPQAQPEATAPSTTALAPATTLAPTTTIARVAVPRLVGMPLAAARSALAGRGLRWIVKYAATRRAPTGTVVMQHRRAGLGVAPGTAVGLVVAKAPPPPPPPPPTSPPVTAPPPSDCSPSYPGVCLHTGIGDYDCEGGSGDGPNYVSGPVRVRPPDPFDLDRDGDGWGCES
jgi:PASTA domain